MDGMVALIIGLLAGLAIGAALVWFVMHGRQQKMREVYIQLKTTHEQADAHHHQQIEGMQKQQQALQHTFNSLAAEALSRNNESFLKLAQEKLQQLNIQNRNQLDNKEKSIEGLLKPIREALDRSSEQMRRMENERKEAYGSLSKHLESMAEAQKILHGETSNLVQALRRPEVRGQWGEMTLKRLAELAGMVDHCDFFEQTHLATEKGSVRPDMIVRLPGGREIIIDAKAPLDAYLGATEAVDEVQRKTELLRHAKNVRDRIKELSLKSYWSQFEQSPEFVVLFIPGEQFLSAALDQDHELLEYGFQQKVILATPTSLIALLRAVAYGWRQERLQENAMEIRRLGEELFGRIATLTEHLGKLGRSLDSSVGHYNKVVGTFDTRIIPSARKFTELGISDEKKPLNDLEQLERVPKEIVNQDLEASLPTAEAD